MISPPWTELGRVESDVRQVQQDLMRKANGYDISTTNDNVDRLECTVRELRATIDELLTRVQELETSRLNNEVKDGA